MLHIWVTSPPSHSSCFFPLSSSSSFEIKAACSRVDWGSHESLVLQRRMNYSRILPCVCVCVCVCVWVCVCVGVRASPSGRHQLPELRSCWQSEPAGWLDNSAVVREQTRSRRRQVTAGSDPQSGKSTWPWSWYEMYQTSVIRHIQCYWTYSSVCLYWW